MDREVEGTFLDTKDIEREISRLIKEENYEADELLILTDEKSTKFDSKKQKGVDVKYIDTSDLDTSDSFWERIKEAFSFSGEDEENPLERYGVSSELAGHYLGVLQDGEYLLLVDQNGPRNNLDQGSAGAAGKSTSGQQAGDKYKEDTQVSKNEEKDTELNKKNEEPDLTGQEDTVEAENETEGTDKANAENQTIKDPIAGQTHVEPYEDPIVNQEDDTAEEDIVYADDTEESGIQSDQENK